MSDYLETAALHEIEAVESKREAERLRPMLDETRARLVEAMAELDEVRRELAQTQASERAVRRLVIRASMDGQRVLSVDEVRAVLDGG
jgi:uncharacterized membrane protein